MRDACYPGKTWHSLLVMFHKAISFLFKGKDKLEVEQTAKVGMGNNRIYFTFISAFLAKGRRFFGNLVTQHSYGP